LFTPIVPATDAVFLVNTKYRAALRTRPSFDLVSRELPDAELLYALEIVDHAHGVFGPVPVVQVVQCGARKAVTGMAMLVSPFFQFPAILDLARDAGFRLEAVVTATTRACVLFPAIGTTEAAVHSTGSDKCCGYRAYLYRAHVGHDRASSVTLFLSQFVPEVVQA
jgi:hypothetical protein